MQIFRSRHILSFAALSLLAVGGFGCKKNTPPPATPAAAMTPAPAATTPVAAAPAVSAEPATAVSEPLTADGVTTQSTTGSSASVTWALKQDEIKNDSTGQWAIAATASSSYGDAKDQQRYSPWQATGAPNVDKESDNPAAWTTKTADAGIEWLDLTFAKPVAATGVRIRESDGAGSIIKVEAFDDAGTAHAVWQGTDPTRGLNYFMLSFPKTSYKTNRVKITLATNLIPGWNEIDAVQLLSSDK